MTNTPAEYVHYHDCPALGPNTKVVRSMRADKSGEVVLYYQLKCPFCSYTAGDRELAPGVVENEDGTFSVDMVQAERLYKTMDVRRKEE